MSQITEIIFSLILNFQKIIIKTKCLKNTAFHHKYYIYLFEVPSFTKNRNRKTTYTITGKIYIEKPNNSSRL